MAPPANAPSFIVLALPVYLVLVGLEQFLRTRAGRARARIEVTLSNLGTGLTEQLLGAVFANSLAFAYFWIHGRAALWDLDARSPWIWCAAFVAVDFTYYWIHRANHGINLLWRGHVVHHQAETLDLSAGLRQSWPAGWFSSLAYLPLAVIGIPPLVYFGTKALMNIYQFWLHTELIGRLPAPIEAVFNTPSHHRVHHGLNREYLGRNLAGTFIVWDRLFGTFEPERAATPYGATPALRSLDPVWAQAHPFAELARDLRRTPGWRAKLRLLGGTPPAGPLPASTAAAPSRGAIAWMALNYAGACAAGLWLLWNPAALAYGERLAWVVAILATLAGVAAVARRARWAPGLELARALALCAAAAAAA